MKFDDIDRVQMPICLLSLGCTRMRFGCMKEAVACKRVTTDFLVWRGKLSRLGHGYLRAHAKH